jgi:hypothetical protein
MTMKWKYKNKVVDKVPEGAEGFIYLISYTDGTKYLGKKSFWSRRRKKVVGKIRKTLVTTESDWRVYRGSSTLGKEKARNGEVSNLEILHFCESKGCLQFLEVVEMIKRKVLCTDKYLNGNILLRLYKCYEPMIIKGIQK